MFYFISHTLFIDYLYVKPLLNEDSIGFLRMIQLESNSGMVASRNPERFPKRVFLARYQKLRFIFLGDHAFYAPYSITKILLSFNLYLYNYSWCCQRPFDHFRVLEAMARDTYRPIIAKDLLIIFFRFWDEKLYMVHQLSKLRNLVNLALFGIRLSMRLWIVQINKKVS